jgi:dihydrofolate reductase
MGRLNYNELSKRRFKEQRNIVISEARNVKTNDLEGYAVTEQLVTEENGKEVRIFLKGGLGLVDKEGLIQLRDCLNEAIEKTNPSYC